jgi:drug/metabolite transporter (DMT)-like permease
MKYLLVFACCLLATAKVTTQSAFSKKSVKSFPDVVFFIGLTFTVSALIFLPDLIGCSPIVWLYGAAFGLSSMLFQISYTRALSMGNVSLTVMMANLAMVFTVLLSAIVFHDPISPARLIGIVLTIAVFVINTDFKTKNKVEKSWFGLALTALLTSGAAGCTQKFFGELGPADESRAFVSASYAVGAVATFALYLILHCKNNRKTYKTAPPVFLYALGVGGFLAIFQIVYQHSINTIPGTFLYPTYAGGCIILSTLAGLVLFKDKLKRRQMISVLFGLVAVVLMNF